MMVTRKQTDQPSQFDVLLTCEQQYRLELQAYPRLPDEEEQRLIERALNGDVQAKHDIVLHILPPLERFVQWYFHTYSWDCGHMPEQASDLVQLGSEDILSRIDDALVTRDRPFAYLLSSAQWCVRHHVRRWCETARQSLSLDAMLEDGQEIPMSLQEQEQASRDFTPLMDAVAALPGKQKEVIERHYGFNGNGADLLCDLSRQEGIHDRTMNSRKVSALETLRTMLRLSEEETGVVLTYHPRVDPRQANRAIPLADCPTLVERLHQGVTIRAIAAEYGVTSCTLIETLSLAKRQGVIHDVASRQERRLLQGKLPPSEWPRIHERLANGETCQHIAADYGVCKQSISRVHQTYLASLSQEYAS